MRFVTPICFLAVALLAFPILAQEGIDADRTFSLDVVELIRGREEPGKPQLVIDYEGFRYQFANEQNLATFKTSPDQFKVALDGGCGRMGSLSGRGNTGLWTVHDGRLYVFASKGCRSGFLEAPERMMERDDQRPTFPAKQMEMGRNTLQQVITAMGGAEKIDAIQSYSETMNEEVPSGDITYDHQTTLTIDFDRRQSRFDSRWNNDTYSRVFHGQQSYFEDVGQRRAMYESAQAACRREMNRNLLTILKSRNRADFQVALIPGTEPDRQTAKRLSVYFDGITVELEIEPTVHLVQSISFRGRGPGSVFGRVTKRLERYQPVNGVMLPSVQTTFFNDAEKPLSRRTYRVAVT